MGLVLFCKHSALVKHLEEEIMYLRMQVSHERQRAEVAIDHLLSIRVNVTPVTRPTREERIEEERELSETVNNPEFAQAGAV